MKDDKFGRLLVISDDWMPDGASNSGMIRCRVRCECGAEKDVYRIHLRNGRTRSCGCLNSDQSRKRLTKHGGVGTPTYGCWSAMIARCKYQSIPQYKNYGGRGIAVCEEWQEYSGFLRDMGYRPSQRHSIERIDNTKGYCPDNCCWATPTEQTRNTRQNVWITWYGEKIFLRDLMYRLNIPSSTYYRVKSRYGLSPEKTVEHMVEIAI